MKHKSIAVALITVLLCMVVGNSVACTTPVTEYHLSIDSTDGGDVSKPGEGRFSYCPQQGERVVLVAVPYPGYHFVNWTGDVGTIADVNGAVTTITVNDDYSITANFAKPYSLTTSSTEGGSVTTPGEGTFVYGEGDVVNLVATPDTGYGFVNWTGDVGTVANVNAASTSITMNGDYSLTANFEELAEYDLTTSSTTGGSVTVPGEGTFTYYDGTVVNLVATANSGYYFINWTGDVGTITNVNAPTTTVTMNDNYSITANFEQIPPGKVALTTSSTAGGSVTTPGEGAFLYNVGEVVSLVASPASGYRFVNWTGNVGTIANVNAASTTITMNGDYSITANFMAVYDLTISSTAGGSVTTPGVGTFTYDGGTVVNLVATANSGYYFINWTGDVGTITNVNAPTTTVTVNDNYSITANFEQIPPGKVVLTTSSTAGGSVTTPGEGAFLYNVGEVVSLVAEAEEGYRFVNWTGDVGTIADVNAASTTVTMDDDYSITASFVKLVIQYDLTISSTDGGSVTVPGEGTFAFDEGTVVNLEAVPESSSWRFVNWTGDVGTAANVNSAITTITMNGDYTITANFVDP
jgi:preprotein translocase subunit YajC/ribosomal protein L21E